jgi:hypothetical protein
MNPQHMILLREKAVLLYQRAAGIPVKARIIFGLEGYLLHSGNAYVLWYQAINLTPAILHFVVT